MLWIIIVVVVLLLLFGGVGYGYRSSWGNYYGGGVGLIGLILIILFVIWLIGARGEDEAARLRASERRWYTRRPSRIALDRAAFV